MRIALGYDSHRLQEGGGLMVGGCFLPCGLAVDGAHSDGDALLHALTDALLSPFGTDIGREFPNTDPQWRGADSSLFVRFAADKLLGLYRIVNIDMLVIADLPKISPRAETIKQKIASLLGSGTAPLSLRGKTTEGTQPYLIQAYCSALFEEK